MHGSHTSIPKTICDFHSKRVKTHLDFPKLEILRFISKILKLVSPLGEKFLFELSEDNGNFMYFQILCLHACCPSQKLSRTV